MFKKIPKKLGEREFYIDMAFSKKLCSQKKSIIKIHFLPITLTKTVPTPE